VVHTFTFQCGKSVLLDEAVTLNRIIFPYLFFISLAALAMAF